MPVKLSTESLKGLTGCRPAQDLDVLERDQAIRFDTGYSWPRHRAAYVRLFQVTSDMPEGPY